MLRHFRKLDWILIASALLLTASGLISIYSSSLQREDFFNFEKQIVFLTAGMILMFFLSFFDWRIFQTNSYIILIFYLFCILSLGGLFFFAPVIRGVIGWYKVGFLSLDPVDFTKFILIILLAKYFSMRHVEMYRLRHIFLSGFYVFLPSVLIFMQPNLGSALILIILWIGILSISGIKLQHFVVLLLCGILIFSLGWLFFLKDYQKARIISFLTPQGDPQGMNWSQTQAKISIGSGGFIGQGLGKGSQTQYGFLPEPQTDFIFAAIAEEFGFVATTVIFITFLVLFWRTMKIANNSQSNFPRLFATGFAIVIFAQLFINVGVNLGILPVIGISLPFVSYGGSGLLTMFGGLGILQSIKVH